MCPFARIQMRRNVSGLIALVVRLYSDASERHHQNRAGIRRLLDYLSIYPQHGQMGASMLQRLKAEAAQLVQKSI